MLPFLSTMTSNIRPLEEFIAILSHRVPVMFKVNTVDRLNTQNHTGSQV